VVKLLVGFLKGAVIGAAVGYGAFAIQDSFSNAWLTYGLIGLLVGLFVGRPLWALIRDQGSTTVTAILKGAFGFGVGCGLYALIAKAWSPSALMIGGQNVLAWTPTLGGAIGAIYGAFVEVDDAIGDDGKKDDKSGPAKQLAAKSAKPAKK
jgi:hypothetical protein